jgi:fused signal recognition particle receptor
MKIFGFDQHKNRDPWDGAPHWAVEIGHMLSTVIVYQELQMSQADDLNNAVTSLATGYGALHDAVQVEIDALLKAFSTVPQPDPAAAKAITDAIANISAVTGTMATDAAKLTASIPAATTVPPPDVTPPATPPTVDIPVIATPPVTDPSAQPPSTPPASATTA